MTDLPLRPITRAQFLDFAAADVQHREVLARLIPLGPDCPTCQQPPEKITSQVGEQPFDEPIAVAVAFAPCGHSFQVPVEAILEAVDTARTTPDNAATSEDGPNNPAWRWAETIAVHGKGATFTVDIDARHPGGDELTLEVPIDDARALHAMLGDAIREAAQTINVCPTDCDDDCETGCHEQHFVPWRRQHKPDGCPGETGACSGEAGMCDLHGFHRHAPGCIPGDRSEELPPRLLSVIDPPPYQSTACLTADACIDAVADHPEHADELHAEADRLYARCRATQKFTGQNCAGRHHRAATDA